MTTNTEALPPLLTDEQIAFCICEARMESGTFKRDGTMSFRIARAVEKEVRAALAQRQQAAPSAQAEPITDFAEPAGGREAGPQEDRIEASYWRFDARRKGYGQWKSAPMSERDAYKAEMRNALEAEKIRTGMRLAAQAQPQEPPRSAPLTEEQLNSACLSYRHDFGLMDSEEQERLRWAAKEWLRAWSKELGISTPEEK